ncbi:hypothetical protein X566_01555 [Afipia sp. P52-10]|uniref:hypothetical protein n=1 Tax=Afipia sp. P52-10 TaxID=1429916 RepID=UPI0003DF460B|nr:hypothetical protein [Afipia sp. P52-10]ETR79296.1 hypothetical protein X566_01555 [Afipia sp. P52-10]
MRSISADNLAALRARRLMARDFLWLVARDRDTGEPVADGQWSDVGPIDAPVIDPMTGGPVTRRFFGSGTLTKISDISLVANLRAQTVTIKMSQVHDRVQEIVRAYDCRRARVEIFRGLYNPVTQALVAPALARFFGFVDKIDIKTPAENDNNGGSVTFSCESHIQALTRSNPDLRSHESQQLRMPGDAFYKDTNVVGDWEHFWGKTNGKLAAEPAGIKSAATGTSSRGAK